MRQIFAKLCLGTLFLYWLRPTLGFISVLSNKSNKRIIIFICKFQSSIKRFFGTKLLQRSVPTQWPQLSWISSNLVLTERIWTSDNRSSDICVKNSTQGSKIFKNFQKKWEALEEIRVLSNGFFGLRNRIFGKFFVLFYLTMFGNTSDLNEILGNSMISVD